MSDDQGRDVELDLEAATSLEASGSKGAISPDLEVIAYDDM